MNGDILIYLTFGIVAFIVILFIGVGLYEFQDEMRGKKVVRNGKIKEKHYEPEHYSYGTGVGPNIGGEGGVAVVSTFNHEDAKWIVLVDVEDMDEYESLKISGKDYKGCKIGDHVLIQYTQGASGTIYGPNGYVLQ